MHIDPKKYFLMLLTINKTKTSSYSVIAQFLINRVNFQNGCVTFKLISYESVESQLGSCSAYQFRRRVAFWVKT